MLLAIAVIVAATVAANGPRAEAAIGCGSVVSYLQSCVPYITNTGPIGSCCSGVNGLYVAAKTKEDRQSVCVCLKTVVGSYSGLDLGKVEGLPATCGIDIPYKISPSTDCAKVN
ncbi:Non-specific lipid-transfer protein 12 [Striga hermonthica]|uniref:Non-specific lipid-transfer protein n=1 Tax=Striga hermonthica TaxID=68872 RepID=A0A9N7NID1_STRHE|nr:Non-specific lipid-transfer protein 12 [Striga hermonthica]